VPVIGFISSSAENENLRESPRLAAFRRALNERGYFEGRNVVFEFRWAEDQYDRLPGLARDQVQRRVDVIVTLGNINTALRPRQLPRPFQSFSLSVVIPSSSVVWGCRLK
jgi:putative ABC transport system substrate-binding protein